MSVSALIHRYYLILFDIAIFAVFLILLKLAMVYAMAKMSSWVNDDPDVEPSAMQRSMERSTQREKRRAPLSHKVFWYGIAGWWTISACLQIRPTMVIPPLARRAFAETIYHEPHTVVMVANWFYQVWMGHPVAYNILSIVIQLLFAAGIFFGRGRLLGHITIWISLPVAISLWVVGEQFGGIFRGSSNLFNGAPGAGFWITLASLLLLFANEQEAMSCPNPKLPRAIPAFLSIATLWQVTPMSGAWSSSKVAAMFPAVDNTTPSWILYGSRVCQRFATHHSIVFSSVLIFIVLVLTVLSIFNHTKRTFLILATATALLSWWIFGGLGFGAAYGGLGGSMPILVLLLWASRN